MTEKEPLYLTHLNLHTRDFRATSSFSKVAAKGLFYVKTPQDAFTKPSKAKASSNTRQFVITFPPDLQERIGKGEVEIMIPKDGLPIYAGKDMWEKAIQMKKAEENRKKPWTRVLRSNTEELK